jgi:hypothetical protein
MDRISDSGSDDMGSNPVGVTKRVEGMETFLHFFEN